MTNGEKDVIFETLKRIEAKVDAVAFTVANVAEDTENTFETVDYINYLVDSEVKGVISRLRNER